jgi:hypothetical protein
MTRAEELGHIAWQDYYDGMQNIHGQNMKRKTYWDNRFYKQFVRIGELCVQHDADVSAFMAAAFGLILKESAYVTPKDFTDQGVWQQYLGQRTVQGNVPERQWDIQVSELTTLECDAIPRTYANEIELLLEPQLPFRAWFRVLYPEAFNEQLFAAYGKYAWAQLHKDRALRIFLRHRVAGNLRELENRLGQFDDVLQGVKHV